MNEFCWIRIHTDHLQGLNKVQQDTAASLQPSWAHANGMGKVCYQAPSKQVFQVETGFRVQWRLIVYRSEQTRRFFSTAVDKMDREKVSLHSD